MSFNFTTTARGFTLIEFQDRYQSKCSIQDSSLATEAAIWLGCSDANAQIMASDAAKFGIVTNETTGWIPYPIPEEVLLSTRMHLTIDQAQDLIKILTTFVNTGFLPSTQEILDEVLQDKKDEKKKKKKKKST